MGYMLIGTFLVAGSMGALEVDQIGWEQFLLQSFIGFAVSLYGFYKDKAEVDMEEREDVVYTTKVRTHGDYCKNPYYN
ncbi:hypothetical protein [Veillonella parvula]|jgi:hypothetical protein|uniref:hypothetical protein n=1 Tax=Veillonella parvula TaxID=29466 RepID=UPI00241EFEE8|nr:hypothetical protein [Veillonella parvula]MBS5152241.1 hypothetical protein [Veillonella parvula]